MQHGLTNEQLCRRTILRRGAASLGAIALNALLLPRNTAAGAQNRPPAQMLADLPHHAPRAKRVIWLTQSGAPSQLDLFDPKPELSRRHGEEFPESVRRGQRLTTMTSDQSAKPIVQSPFKFQAHGECGMELSELLPHTAKVVDHLCMIRSMYTEAINHDPAITLLQTGTQQPGRPSWGAWVTYGLGTEAENLPAFVVMVSGGDPNDQPLFQRLWGTGFLPSHHQAVRFRPHRDAVHFLNDPPGVTRNARREMLDVLGELNRHHQSQVHDVEIESRIRQFETAFAMQMAVPEVTDLRDEPESTFTRYGEDAKQPGTYAANCLLARRLAERGVRFVQLYHRGWDHHSSIETRLKKKCEQTDQASAALIADLAERGLLDDTLVIWGGEFGRTTFCQGRIDAADYGRDHHPRCFSLWMAGGGVKSGHVHGATDEWSYNVTDGAMHVHDLQATVLHLLGINHEKFTYRFQGRDQRLTDIGGRVVDDILS